MIRAEETPSASDELWKAIFDRSPTMYFIVDAAGITISVNAYGAEQLGYARDELVGSPVLNIFYETDREAVRRNVDRCFAQPDSHMSWEAAKDLKARHPKTRFMFNHLYSVPLCLLSASVALATSAHGETPTNSCRVQKSAP